MDQQVVVSSATFSLQLPSWEAGDDIRKDYTLNDFGRGGSAPAVSPSPPPPPPPFSLSLCLSLSPRPLCVTV